MALNLVAEPIRTLVANDHEWTARSLESILVPEGYQVIRAQSGQQTLDRIWRDRPDLLLLDLQMPDFGGIEICRTLRGDSRFDPSIPILITTAGTAGRAERLEAYRAGAWDFLYQPLDRDTLLAKLRSYLNARLAVRSVRARCLVDEATGLYNADGLIRRGGEIAAEAVRRKEPVSYLVLRPIVERDVAGEGEPLPVDEIALVPMMTDLLHRRGRRADAFGRLGPQGFGVVAPRTEGKGVQRFVARLEADGRALISGDTAKHFRLRAGYCVQDGRDAQGPGSDPAWLLAQAAAAADATDRATPVRAA